eukprot:SAG25_NODE_258_length_10908_cov_53.385569_9_plen_162_part_00
MAGCEGGFLFSRLFSRLAQSSVAAWRNPLVHLCRCRAGLRCPLADCTAVQAPELAGGDSAALAAVYGSPRLTIRGEEIMNDMGCNRYLGKSSEQLASSVLFLAEWTTCCHQAAPLEPTKLAARHMPHHNINMQVLDHTRRPVCDTPIIGVSQTVPSFQELS